MNIFLTGHRGFLGRNLARKLRENNDAVETIEQKITPELARELKLEHFDAVVHLAGRTPQSIAGNRKDFQKDVLITEAIAKRCLDSNTDDRGSQLECQRRGWILITGPTLYPCRYEG